MQKVPGITEGFRSRRRAWPGEGRATSRLWKKVQSGSRLILEKCSSALLRLERSCCLRPRLLKIEYHQATRRDGVASGGRVKGRRHRKSHSLGSLRSRSVSAHGNYQGPGSSDSTPTMLGPGVKGSLICQRIAQPSSCFYASLR